jgi:hypothetical protein
MVELEPLLKPVTKSSSRAELIFRAYDLSMTVLDSSVKPLLPSPDTIYYKDFHFLDEPLIQRREST